MRRLAIAMALACVLSGATHAGEMASTGAVAPPPPCTVTETGETPTTCTPAPQESSTVLTVILTLITFVP
jgi:hypothetical protein